MGMDVYGKNPKSSAGEYFRNNCWHWRPLWRYCEYVAPDICKKVKYAQSNDGDGLGARDSKELAKTLETMLKTGQTKAYETAYRLQQEALPDEVCEICHGSGRRVDMSVANGCNGCAGTGKGRNWDAEYPFSVENVEEFVAFLKECGGFKIC
jgi:hypothetical protein